MTPPANAAAPRPTRAQRREATQAALLDATIASLIEDGYTAMTTRGVAERAGVSQGALQHHYATKAALVDAAVKRLADQVAAAIVAHPPAAKSDRERVGLMVDTLWKLHNLPLAAAIFEFINAARTDPDIADSVVDLLNHVDDLGQATAAQVVPGLAAIPGAKDWLRITMATIRGAVLITAIPGNHALPAWTTIRKQIMRSFDAIIVAGN